MRGNKFETLITVDSRPMFTICQDFYFTVGERFYKNVGILLGDCLTCEELSGRLLGGSMSL